MDSIIFDFNYQVCICDTEDGSRPLRRAISIHNEICNAILYSQIPEILRDEDAKQSKPRLLGFWTILFNGPENDGIQKSLKFRLVSSLIMCRAGTAMLKVTFRNGAGATQVAWISFDNDAEVSGYGS